MRTYDFAPLTRSSIGFDRLFDLINSNAQQLPTQEPGFPSYDITRTGDDSYRITLAIAGFSLADYVEVVGATCENGLLQIELVRRIPEAMKPRRIPINGKKNSKAG